MPLPNPLLTINQQAGLQFFSGVSASANNSHGGSSSAGASGSNAGQAKDPQSGAAGDSAGGTSAASSGGGSGSAGSQCTTVETTYTPDPSPHVAGCSLIPHATDPPSSGPHYPIWAKLKAYSSPVPRGFTIRDLEHGAIVVSYNCTESCDAEVASLIDYVNALPVEPMCYPTINRRLIITPDPLFTHRFAAAAWGVSLVSDCFDLNALGQFIFTHTVLAPDNVCADGVDVLDPAVYTLPQPCPRLILPIPHCYLSPPGLFPQLTLLY